MASVLPREGSSVGSEGFFVFVLLAVLMKSAVLNPIFLLEARWSWKELKLGTEDKSPNDHAALQFPNTLVEVLGGQETPRHGIRSRRT